MVATATALEARILLRSLGRGAANTLTVVAVDAAGNRSSSSSVVTLQSRGRPAGLPRGIPRWAWDLLAWREGGSAGTRPAAAPKRVPAWFWRWADWRLHPYRIAA